jgi:hypothetical protein
MQPIQLGLPARSEGATCQRSQHVSDPTRNPGEDHAPFLSALTKVVNSPVPNEDFRMIVAQPNLRRHGSEPSILLGSPTSIWV